MVDEVTPSVSYVYNTSNGAASSGGPLFILIYIQCGMFILNEWFKIGMELWQLLFPLFIIVVMFVVGYMNQNKS